MAFEVFKGAGTKNKDFISVTTSKTFGFPRAFVDKNNIKDNAKVVILFDKETRKIALYFTENDSKYAYAFRRSKNKQHGGAVIARNFFETMGMDLRKYASRYEYEKHPIKELGFPGQEGYAYVIELKENRKPDKNTSSEQVIYDEDTPINLADIPF